VRDALAGEPSLAVALVDPRAEPLLAPHVVPPLTAWQAEGLDLILEGFLLHHGRARHLDPADQDAAVLAGDYCYAQGLIRIADAGDLFHIRALADLIALAAGLVAAGARADLPALWRATAGAMAARGGPGERATASLHAAACDHLRAGDLPAARPALDELAARVPATPELTEVLT
jgi:hypothetical protein